MSHRVLGFLVVLGLLPFPAAAEVSLTPMTMTLGGSNTDVFYATPDTSVILGTSYLAGDNDFHAYRLTGGVMTDLGTLGGSYSDIRFYTPDASVIVGVSSTVGDAEEHVYRWTGGVMTDLGTLGGNGSSVGGMSADGSVIFGGSYLANFEQRAFRWESGVMTDLGTLGGTYSSASAMSTDGDVIVGSSRDVTDLNMSAFRWEGGMMTDLGTLGGSYSYAEAVSANGDVVVGESYIAGNIIKRAFRWEGGVMTDLGSFGGEVTEMQDMTDDGSVIVGSSQTTGDAELHAFRWENGVLEDLGTLGGIVSNAHFVSTDGSIVSGVSSTVSDADEHVFRWKNGIMTDLGTLGGVNASIGGMSADGSVILGASDAADAESYTFLWHEDTGTMKSLEEILTSAGVDITGWRFAGTKNIMLSENGELVYGSADFNGDNQGFLMTATGLTTPVDLAESLAAAPVPAQQGSQAVVSGVGQSLSVARNALSMYLPRVSAPAAPVENPRLASADPMVLSDVEPAAGGGDGLRVRQRFSRAFYAIGDVGVGHNDNFKNYGLSGATGLLVGVSDSLAIGGGFVGSYSRLETSRGGHSAVDALGVSFMAAYEPAEEGLRVYGTASAVPLNIKTKRNYVNGVGIDSSTGETEGMGYGAAVRVGWAIAVTDQASIMPYAEGQWSKTKIDAYTEQGGGIPASYAAQDSDTWISRLGVEFSHAATPDLTFRWRGAWGHRYGDSNGVRTTAMGITQTISDAPGERDWAEGGIGAVWRVTDKTTMSLDLSGRAGKTGEPALGVMVGMTVNF